MEIIEDFSFDSRFGALTHFRGQRHLVLAVIEGQTFLTFDLLRHRMMGIVSTSIAQDDAFWDRRLLPISIGIMGTTLGIAPLHCACLERNGDGLLIAGASGAGKSTLTAALARRGFSFISDDWTYLSKIASGLTAYGLASPVKLLPDAVRFFDELRECPTRATLNGEIAYEIDPRETLSAKIQNEAHPRWLFFLERNGAPGCSFLPCRGEYARAFFEHSAERLPEEVPEATTARSALINALTERPCWILRSGDSPHATAEALDNFLESLSHAAA